MWNVFKIDSKEAMLAVGKAALLCLYCSIFSVSFEQRFV